LSALHQAGFATLTVDLLASGDAHDGAAAFNTAALTPRLVAVTRWLAAQPEAQGKQLAYLAGVVVAGSAFCAAAELRASGLVAAVVPLNGRASDISASWSLSFSPRRVSVGSWPATCQRRISRSLCTSSTGKFSLQMSQAEYIRVSRHLTSEHNRSWLARPRPHDCRCCDFSRR
jgi:hypothetical protein